MSMTGHPTPSSNPWNKILKMMEKANWTFGIVILTLLLFWWNFDDGSFKMLSLNYNLIPQLTASFGAETKHVAVVADFEGNFKDLIHMGAELMANLTYLGYSVKLVVTVEKSLGVASPHISLPDWIVILDQDWHARYCESKEPGPRSMQHPKDWSRRRHRQNMAVLNALARKPERIIILQKILQHRNLLEILQEENGMENQTYYRTVYGTGQNVFKFWTPLDNLVLEFPVLTNNFESLGHGLVSITHHLPKQKYQLAFNMSSVIIGGKSFSTQPPSDAITELKEDAFWSSLSFVEKDLNEGWHFIVQAMLWKTRKLSMFKTCNRSDFLQSESDERYQSDRDYGLLKNISKNDADFCHQGWKKCLFHHWDTYFQGRQNGGKKYLLWWIVQLENIKYTFPTIPKRKKFVYMVNGYGFDGQDNLQWLKTKESSDFFMSCYKKKGCDIFYPNSTNIEGRNAALRLALSFDQGYLYFIFNDDDVYLSLRKKTTNETSPWKVFEGFLLSRQPAFGLPKYNYWKTAADKKRKIISGDYRAVRVWDECFTAYHRETIGSIIPSFEISFYRNNWWLYGFIPELLVATSYPLESAAIQYEHTVILNKLHRGGYPLTGSQRSLRAMLGSLSETFNLDNFPKLIQNKELLVSTYSKNFSTLYTLFDDLDQEFSNLARNTREHRKDGTNTHIISEKTLKKILNTAGELYKFIEKYRSSPLLWEVLDLNQPRVN